MWLTIVSSMGYNLVLGVSGIFYGVTGGYNQLVLRVSDNSSTSFLVFFGHFRLFSGNSDVFIRLPLVSSLGCNSAPGVSCTFYGLVGGYSSTLLTGVFGYFRSFAGISEESMWLTVVFSMGCNFVPGVSCILVLGFRGFPAIREHVLRVFSVTSCCPRVFLRGQCGLPLGLLWVTT